MINDLTMNRINEFIKSNLIGHTIRPLAHILNLISSQFKSSEYNTYF